jgi:hypothetical protein
MYHTVYEENYATVAIHEYKMHGHKLKFTLEQATGEVEV